MTRRPVGTRKTKRATRGIRVRGITVGVLGLLFAGAAQAAWIPHVECTPSAVPSGTRLTIVGRDTVVNGLPMSMIELHSPRSRQAVLNWYEKRWTLANGQPHYIRYRVGAWQVIAQKQGSCSETVQLENQGSGSVGLIGISRPAVAQRRVRHPRFPALAGSQSILHLLSNDGGKIGQTWLFTNSGSVMQNARFYLGRFRRAGWVDEMSQKESVHDRTVVVLMLQKGSRTAQIVVEPSATGSFIVATRVHHG